MTVEPLFRHDWTQNMLMMGDYSLVGRSKTLVIGSNIYASTRRHGGRSIEYNHTKTNIFLHNYPPTISCK